MDFRRKTIRLEPARYTGRNSYFITFCCAGRRAIFANPKVAQWLIKRLRELSVAHRFGVFAYCVMPNHFHALVAGLDNESNLIAFITDLKQKTAHTYQQRTGSYLWQKRFYDRVLRAGERAEAVAGYIWMNPVRQSLSAHPYDYPHSGSFILDWKKGFSPNVQWQPEWKTKRFVSHQTPKLSTSAIAPPKPPVS
jgi:REP element-mobilizing transposase RayT